MAVVLVVVVMVVIVMVMVIGKRTQMGIGMG